MWGVVASFLRKHNFKMLFPSTEASLVPDTKSKLCGHCCDVNVQNLAWSSSWPLFQKSQLKMSDKPDKSMRPDDHRRKWDSVEYEKNAQARLELEEAIEKSRERKDRLVRNLVLPLIWLLWFESLLGNVLDGHGSWDMLLISGVSQGLRGTSWKRASTRYWRLSSSWILDRRESQN